MDRIQRRSESQSATTGVYGRLKKVRRRKTLQSNYLRPNERAANSEFVKK